MCPADAGDWPLQLRGEGERRGEKASLNLLIENDYFAGHDQDYTNGFSLGYLSATEDPEELSLLSNITGTVLGGGCAADGWCRFMEIDRSQRIEHQWGVSLNQLMFTPESDPSLTEPQYGEHPYAAWLSIGLTTMVKSEDRNNALDLYLGMVGPAALGRPTQDFVHSMIGSPKWKGWDNQIPNEFAVLVSFERKYRMKWMEARSGSGAWRSDGYAAWNGDFGNVYIRGGLNAYFRYGYNMPAHCSYLSWEPNHHTTAPFSGMQERLGNWSIYGFCGLRGRVVLYDIFLDGTMFRNSPVTVDKYPVVADLFFGGCISYKDWDVVFGYTRRTKEYHRQNEPNWMGSAAVRVAF